MTELDLPEVLPGDIVCFRTRARGHIKRWWASFLIRVGSQTPGEGPTLFNHVAGVVGHTLRTAGPLVVDDYTIVEALPGGITKNRLVERYGDSRVFDVLILRRLDMTDAERQGFAAVLLESLGEKYGFGKIVLQTVDWLASWGLYFITAKKVKRDLYGARRLARVKKLKICSFQILGALKKIGKPMRVPVSQGTPDDIADEALASPDWADIYHTPGLDSALKG